MTHVKLRIDEKVWALFKAACAAVGRSHDECATESLKAWVIQTLGNNKVLKLVEGYSTTDSER